MAISFTPGQVISWEDLNAMLAQHGSPQGAKSIVQLPNKPLTDEEKIAIEKAGGDPDAVRPITVRYWMEDGSAVDAVLDQPGEQTGDGVAGSGQGSTFRIVEYKPSVKYTAANPVNPTSAAQQKPPGGSEGPEGTPDTSKAGGFDNGRPRWVVRDAKGTEIWARPLEPAERTAWEKDKNAGKTDAEIATPPKEEVNPSDPTRLRKPDGQGGWTDAGPNAAGVQAAATAAEARAARPGTKIGSETKIVDGNQVTVETWRLPDGTKEDRVDVAPAPNKPNPHTVVVDGITYERQPDGSGYKPAIGLPQSGDKVPIPGDYPQYAPDYSHQDGDLGLTSYARQVRGLKNLTKEQQDQLIKEAHGVASTVVSRNTSTINTQEGIRNAGITQRGQDSTQANARLAAGASMATNAISQAAEQTKYSTGPDAMAVAPYYMALGRALVQSMGGLENAPRIEDGPALRQAGQMLMAGQGLPSVAGAIAGPNGPFPQPPMAAPAVAAPMPMPATPDLAVPAGPGAATGPAPLPAPIFRPQQPAQLPPAALPPAPSLGPGQDISAPQGAMPPGGQVAPMLGAGPWQQQPQQFQPTGAVGLQMAAAQGYDPTSVNAAWKAAGVELDDETWAMLGGLPVMPGAA